LPAWFGRFVLLCYRFVMIVNHQRLPSRRAQSSVFAESLAPDREPGGLHARVSAASARERTSSRASGHFDQVAP
jgi:hypothetical protein